ncbi:MAG: cation:proton antiporter [Coriobacteriia bacterium]|nr:cation:proton antiporter [Coriobacteriia bacterium]
METLQLVLLLSAAVLISSVVSQFLPKVPTSLIQILMGVGIAIIAAGQVDVKLDPELFLVLFIAPLLYDDARNASLTDLWRYKSPILIYAIGLVVAIVLMVGFALNWVMPSIPLAACFALGAALGPTDAVAVAVVSRQTDISQRNKAILKGEALLNDASGLVCFQFAVAAVVTGAFSLVDAGIEFLVLFFGGLLVGVLSGVALNYAIRKIRETGLQDTTFHVLLEIFIPFMVYLIAEGLHVSGIIAVVLCGIVNAITPRASGVTPAHNSVVSSGVWKVLSFVLNGIVFVLLGTQLPSSMESTWANYAIPNESLIVAVLVITLALELVRFLFSLSVEWIAAHRAGDTFRFTKQSVLSALALTLSGAKGTITLSIMFSLPLTLVGAGGEVEPFPYRDLLLFLACGVILTTLLLATFVVPLLVPKKKVQESEAQRRERDVAALLDILRTVIEELTERQTRETAAATASVVAAYNNRITRIKDDNDLGDEKNIALRLRCIGWEKEFIAEQMAQDALDYEIAYEQLSRLERREILLRHDNVFSDMAARASRLYRRLRANVRRMQQHIPFLEPSERSMALRDLQMREYEYVIRRLQQDMASMEEDTEDVAATVLEYQALRDQLRMQMPSVTALARTADKGDEIELLALRLELKFINEAVEQERMSRPYAKRLRENVYLMQLDLEDRI